VTSQESHLRQEAVATTHFPTTGPHAFHLRKASSTSRKGGLPLSPSPSPHLASFLTLSLVGASPRPHSLAQTLIGSDLLDSFNSSSRTDGTSLLLKNTRHPREILDRIHRRRKPQPSAHCAAILSSLRRQISFHYGSNTAVTLASQVFIDHHSQTTSPSLLPCTHYTYLDKP
jgi:hypothetical protein